MIEAVLFTLFLILFFLIPGNLIYRLLKLKQNLLFNFLFSLITGLTLFFYISIIIRFLHLPYVLINYLIYAVILCYYFVGYKNELFKINIKKLFSRKLIVPAFIFLLSVYLLSAMHLKSGFKDGEFLASAARDAMWRISIIEELRNHFPPQHPGFAYLSLKNYHYFYDFLIASAGLITNIGSTSLYYYYFTLLSASIFVLCSFLFIRLFAKSELFRNIGVFLVVFTGNVSFLLPLISKQYNFFASNNAFMSDQPFDQGYNPFNLLTYGMFLFIIYLLYKWEEKPDWKIVIVFSFILGFIPGIKIYAGIILFASLGFVVLRLIFKRSKYALLFSLPYLIFLPFYFLIKGPMATSIIFRPFWLLDRMVTDLDRLKLDNLILKEQHYKSTNNYLRIAQIKIEEIIIYLLGNFNTRIFAIFWLFGQFLNIRKITYTNQFIITSILISLSIPLLFFQSRGVYDIIQFTPYGLILLSVISVGIIEKIILTIDKKIRLVAVVITIIIVVFSSITSFYLAFQRAGQTPIAIPAGEVEALEYLKLITNPDDVILSDLTGNKVKVMYIPALSGRRLFLSSPELVDQTGIDMRERTDVVNMLEYLRPVTKSDDLMIPKEKAKIIAISSTDDKKLILYIPGPKSQIDSSFVDRTDIVENYVSKSISPAVTYVYLSEGGIGATDLLTYLGYELVFSNNSAAIFKLKN